MAKRSDQNKRVNPPSRTEYPSLWAALFFIVAIVGFVALTMLIIGGVL